MRRPALILIAAISLAGCVESRQQQQPPQLDAASRSCEANGLLPGTPPFAKCVQQATEVDWTGAGSLAPDVRAALEAQYKNGCIAAWQPMRQVSNSDFVKLCGCTARIAAYSMREEDVQYARNNPQFVEQTGTPSPRMNDIQSRSIPYCVKEVGVAEPAKQRSP